VIRPERDGCQPCKSSNDVSWKKVNTKIHLNVNGKIILEGEQVKLLGVNINNNLNFNSHIKEIGGKVNEKTRAFSKLRGYVSEKKAILRKPLKQF